MRTLTRNRRGGAILDVVVAAGLILFGAFVLAHFGLTFHEILNGARQFFGI
jgi:hypothetical protein